MRRLLALALLASCFAAPAAADPCDPETGECHPVDCVAWDPLGQAPYAVEVLLGGDPAHAVTLLLPPPCPPA